MELQSAARERKFREEPFAYQNKPTLRLIREKAGDDHRLKANASYVYIILTELASDKASNTFSATWREIANMSGLSSWTVRQTAPFLAKHGFITIVHSRKGKLNNPNQFTLLSTPSSGGSGEQNVKRQVRRVCLPSTDTSVDHQQVIEYKNIEINTPPAPPKGGELTPPSESNTKKPGKSDQRQKNTAREWFMVPNKLADQFKTPENIAFLNQPDKRIIPQLPKIADDYVRSDSLLADIQTVYNFAKKEPVSEALLKKLIALDNILTKFDDSYKIEDGIEKANQRGHGESLSYLDKLLCKAYRKT